MHRPGSPSFLITLAGILIVVAGFLLFWFNRSNRQALVGVPTSQVVPAPAPLSSGNSNSDLNSDLNSVDSTMTNLDSSTQAIDASLNDTPIPQPNL